MKGLKAIFVFIISLGLFAAPGSAVADRYDLDFCEAKQLIELGLLIPDEDYDEEAELRCLIEEKSNEGNPEAFALRFCECVLGLKIEIVESHED